MDQIHSVDQRKEPWLISLEFWAVTLGQIFPPRWTPVSSPMKSTGSFSSNPVIPRISTSTVLISEVRVFVGPSKDSQTQLEQHWGRASRPPLHPTLGKCCLSQYRPQLEPGPPCSEISSLTICLLQEMFLKAEAGVLSPPNPQLLPSCPALSCCSC